MLPVGPNKDLHFGLSPATPARPDGAGAETDAYRAWEAGLDERETRTWTHPGKAMRPAFLAGYAAGAAAERAKADALAAAIERIHERHEPLREPEPNSPYAEPFCALDLEAWPCPTIEAILSYRAALAGEAGA